MEKGVDGAHALFDPAGQLGPFARRDHAGHDIERDQAFVGLFRAIDVEGDAGAAKEVLGVEGFAPQILHVLGLKPRIIGGVGGAGMLAPAGHFVEKSAVVGHCVSLRLA
jgi:hypothetical protein